MQDAQLTFRLPADLKDKLQDRALVESLRGSRVTMADVLVRVLSQASARWATAKGKA